MLVRSTAGTVDGGRGPARRCRTLRLGSAGRKAGTDLVRGRAARSAMNIVHLTASTFYGGPERQMLGLARVLADECRSAFLLFSEGGRCLPFAQEARRQGFQSTVLTN